MKTYGFSVLVLLLVASLQMANAQEKRYEIVVGGGFDTPLSPDPFTDAFHTGWTIKLAGGYFVTPQLALGTNLSLNRFGFDESQFVTIQNSTEISGNDLLIFEVAGVGKYYFLPRARTVNAYVLGGPGIAHVRNTDFTFRNIAGELVTVEGEGNTEFMLTAGAGVTYQIMGRWRVFAEGRYSHIFTEDDGTAHLPIRVGFVL